MTLKFKLKLSASQIAILERTRGENIERAFEPTDWIAPPIIRGTGDVK